MLKSVPSHMEAVWGLSCTGTLATLQPIIRLHVCTSRMHSWALKCTF